jgi:cell wall-associated NlpC family hydrolase
VPQHGTWEEIAVVIARALARMSLPIAFVLGLTLATAAPVAATAGPDELASVIDTAKSKIGANWVHYARGPNTFDCVGFVWYAFKTNDLQHHIGGYRGVKSYYNWFKERGLAATSNPQRGDLVIWGKFKHIGIYLGDGMAISALVQPYGVKIHPVKGYINMKVKAYLHTQLNP